MGSQLVLQLLLEATLAGGCGDGDAATARLDAFVDQWRALPPLKAGPSPLLDGAALMEATGLTPGARLGRLKEWLWRTQVERDLACVADVAALLEKVSDMDDLVVQFDGSEPGKRFIEAWKRARIIVDSGGGGGTSPTPPATPKP